MTKLSGSAFLLTAALVATPASLAADHHHHSDNMGKKDCDMTYTLKGWSAVYKTAKGEGTITCNNGDTAQVEISVHGGGLSFGKTEIYNGKAEISGVHAIGDIYGSYASASAHAGVAKTGEVEVMSKGSVSLALAGSGEGTDVGIDFSKFTIHKPGTKS